MEQSLRSFSFFIKERNNICVLISSYKRMEGFLPALHATFIRVNDKKISKVILTNIFSQPKSVCFFIQGKHADPGSVLKMVTNNFSLTKFCLFFINGNSRYPDLGPWSGSGSRNWMMWAWIRGPDRSGFATLILVPCSPMPHPFFIPESMSENLTNLVQKYCF